MGEHVQMAEGDFRERDQANDGEKLTLRKGCEIAAWGEVK